MEEVFYIPVWEKSLRIYLSLEKTLGLCWDICHSNRGYEDFLPRAFLKYMAEIKGVKSIKTVDEPTAGLDPKERISIRNYIAELSKDKIILFATHIVSDIGCIADKVILLKQGEIIADGTPSELIEAMAGEKLER